jgi:hypothetical protein
MDVARFDDFTRSWDTRSRRAHLGWLTGCTVSGVPLGLGFEGAGAKDRNKNKKKKKTLCPKKGCPDGFGCCAAYNRCCPFGLSICCPFGCCPENGDYFCGTDASTPCLRVGGG